MPAQIDHAEFIKLLGAQFPEVIAEFDEYGSGLLHCEMGRFAQVAEKALDRRDFSRAQKYFEFVDRVRPQATPEVQNAVDVSFIEFLALSEFSEARSEGLTRMPPAVRAVLIEIDGRGRWGRR
jgi:hypothetical protein